MAENESRDIVHVAYANGTKLGDGDGSTRLFPLVADGRRVVPTNIVSVNLTDWQGQGLPAYSFARTNLLSASFDFTAARGWTGFHKNPSVLEPSLIGPDGLAGHVSTIRMGDCDGGPEENMGGIVQNGAAASLIPGADYVGSIWMRSEQPMRVAIAVDAVQYNGGIMVTVTNQWKRYSVPKTIRPGGAPRAFHVVVSKADNPTINLDTKLSLCYAQVGLDNGGGVPSRFILTDGNPVTQVDYVLNDSNVILTSALAAGGEITWTGSAYWVELGSAPVVPNLDLLRGVTWRFDQSPKLLSLLRDKETWYINNYTNFWEGWYGSIFRLKSANSFGVAVWAFILNLPLSVLGLQDRYRYWAFGINRSNYADSTGPVNPSSGNFPPVTEGGAITTPQEKIQALRLRYYALTSNCSIAAINRALYDVFGEVGSAYVVDHEDMTMTYAFDFPLSASFQQAMLQYGLLPKPAGVQIKLQVP